MSAAKDRDQQVEMTVQAGGCPEGRHVAQARACAWRPGNPPCHCRSRVLIEYVLGGQIDENG